MILSVRGGLWSPKPVARPGWRHKGRRATRRCWTAATAGGMLRSMVPGGEAKLMAQLRRGSIQYCVLALLRDRDRYGFELTRQLAGADGLVTSEGTVYPLLARLRHEGLVETTWQESSQGPPRRYYHLTEDGHRALDAFAGQWRRFRDAIDAVLDEESADGRSSCERDSESVFPKA